MRIYLSSTYTDLVDHRAAVARVLRQMGHEVIGMEGYVAEGARPLVRCLRDLKSSILYVGIFAWRYGYVPRVRTDAAGKGDSITVHELRHAVRLNMRPLVFLVDPKASWPAQMVDAVSGTREDAAAVKRLRDELSRRWLAGFFTTPDDLARQVSAAVYRSEVVNRLHSVSATPALSESLMNAPISESSLGSLTQGLLKAQELEALTIDLRDGNYWWSTRLFFLATVAEELVGTRLFIFVERGGRYLGVATAETVRDRLAATKAPGRAFLEHCRKNPVDRTDLMHALGQRSQHWQVAGVAKAEAALKAKVSSARLRRWLKTDLLTRSVARSGETVTTAFLRGIVDWPHPQVPITQNNVLSQVVARAAVTSDLADLFVKSLDGARN